MRQILSSITHPKFSNYLTTDSAVPHCRETRLPEDQWSRSVTHSFFKRAEDGNRRGAPSRYQWDDIWVELCAMIFLDGLPETQAELVQHIARWLESRGKPVPDDSTIKKKIKPLWQRLREPMERHSVSHNA